VHANGRSLKEEGEEEMNWKGREILINDGTNIGMNPQMQLQMDKLREGQIATVAA
jgi:hypothetical protein